VAGAAVVGAAVVLVLLLVGSTVDEVKDVAVTGAVLGTAVSAAVEPDDSPHAASATTDTAANARSAARQVPPMNATVLSSP